MRSRLLVRSAKATVGIGERRSSAKGSGMEFLDYREYQPGDDVRHLDPHLFARTGTHYVRQYSVYQQLPIAIIVDGSASMNFGTPTTFDLDSELKVLGSLRQEIVAVHVTAPEELDPARLGPGETRFVDAESGHEVELLIDEAVLGDYKAALAVWQDRVRQRIRHHLGRYL